MQSARLRSAVAATALSLAVLGSAPAAVAEPVADPTTAVVATPTEPATAPGPAASVTEPAPVAEPTQSAEAPTAPAPETTEAPVEPAPAAGTTEAPAPVVESPAPAETTVPAPAAAPTTEVAPASAAATTVPAPAAAPTEVGQTPAADPTPSPAPTDLLDLLPEDLGWDDNLLDLLGEVPLLDELPTTTLAKPLAITPSCKAVTISNPVGNPALGVVYGSPLETQQDGLVVVLPGTTKTITTTRKELVVAAATQDEQLAWLGYGEVDQACGAATRPVVPPVVDRAPGTPRPAGPSATSHPAISRVVFNAGL